MGKLVQIPDCKYVRSLGMNGQKYDQKMKLHSSESKYMRLARNVVQELNQRMIGMNNHLKGSRENQRQKLETLGSIFFSNFKDSEKNHEINRSLVENFQNKFSK